MTYKLLAAAVLSLGMGTAAFAQSDTQNNENSVMLPSGWEGAVSEAFFADPAAGTLRTEDEAKANFANLSADQQAMVTEHCATMASTDAMGSDDNMTTSSTSETSATGPAEIAQICEWASGM